MFDLDNANSASDDCDCACTTNARLNGWQLVDDSIPLLGIFSLYGLFASFSKYAIGNIGMHNDNVFSLIGTALMWLFLMAGLLTGLLYVYARGRQLAGDCCSHQ